MIAIVKKIIKIRWVRFVLVGGLNATVLLAIVNSLAALFRVYSGIGIVILNTSAFMLVVVMSYFFNKHFTFEHTKKRTVREFFSFAAITLVGLYIQSTILYFLTTIIGPRFGFLPHTWLFFVSLAAIIISSVWNFFAYTFIVFKDELQK